MIDFKEYLFEFANISPKHHKFGVDVKIHIMQPGERKLSHGPRAKVFKNSNPKDFSISLNVDPNKIQVIGDYKEIVSTKELNILLVKIRKYRIPLINMWFDSRMDLAELEDEMEQIDRGFEVEKKF